jgi:uncharacterized protein (DUF433 family)
MAYERISVNLDQLGGVPRIRGRCIPVATVVEMVAEGMTTGDILQASPDRASADIPAALHFATHGCVPTTDDDTAP